MRISTLYILIALQALLLSASGVFAGYAATFRNFNSKGLQVTRFDTGGNAVDAHDGGIALFDGLYYLYGTSYDCGYQWGVAGAPFCGFNASTKKYVLWIKVYDNRVGFRVFTSSKPVGPFVEIAVPALAVNNDSPVAGLNNGDHDTFLNDDGMAYIAYTDWRTGGGIVIERLDSTYQSGSGNHVKAVTPSATEAPSLFRRGGAYYITYSDPNCGYCATGTSYRTASSPLGPWSAGVKITPNSCGG